jgi:predicted nucleotide-binding protein
MKPYEELFKISNTLNEAAAAGDSENIEGPLRSIEKAAKQTARAFSGSWLGYHATVYYAGLVPAPPGANFSQEWGLKDFPYSDMGSNGDWREYDPEVVKAHILKAAGSVDLTPALNASRSAVERFNSAKSEILSIIENEVDQRADKFLDRLKVDLDKLEPMSALEIVQVWAPKGQFMTRDTLAAGQGNRIPPHVKELAEVASIDQAFRICKAAAEISAKAASHLERKSRRQASSDRIGTNVFIGHGRSQVWRELKDFVQDRLGLPWDEFNRVPVAGVTNIARLSEMLDASAIAIVVMTAEDELLDGEIQARMNVVHEAGLFQGRLGFTKAIVLIEDGCKEFSNIQGLGQIRFPKANIAAAFEEIRRVLEREGLIES